jgi:dinuclear metal center YbgI/SA1388 family protein
LQHFSYFCKKSKDMAKTLSVGDFDTYLNKFAPPSLAEEWDHVGLQVGVSDSHVSGVLVSLDVTEPVLWEAVEHDANLVVTHHPLLLRPIRRLDDSSVATRLARLAVQMDVNVLSFHTNLDSTAHGLNDLLAKALGLQSPKPLLPANIDHSKMAGLPAKHPGAGLGRVGKIQKTTLKALLKKISRNLRLKELRYVGDPKHPIQKAAVMTGSGGGFFSEAKNGGADVLITGDVKYHHALDALAEGIALIDIGHFAGEIGMVEFIAKQIRSWVKSKGMKLKVHETKTQSDPIQYWHR